jgi:dynein heavy chain
VTPTSYLELIGTFDKLLSQKRHEIANLRDRYANGYQTLVATEDKVNTLQAELTEMQPIIATKKEEAEK